MEAGWQGNFPGGAWQRRRWRPLFNMRKTTIYGGSNEVQRNIVAQTVPAKGDKNMDFGIFLTTRNS